MYVLLDRVAVYLPMLHLAGIGRGRDLGWRDGSGGICFFQSAVLALMYVLSAVGVRRRRAGGGSTRAGRTCGIACLLHSVAGIIPHIAGDWFYIVSSGSYDVRIDGQTVFQYMMEDQGANPSFGLIATMTLLPAPAFRSFLKVYHTRRVLHS